VTCSLAARLSAGQERWSSGAFLLLLSCSKHKVTYTTGAFHAQASQRGEKMRVCRERASSDLRRLKQTIERTNRERMDRFMELATTHVTATEIQKQMKERQKRATDISLEIAGDLDENGEAELRCAVHSLDAKRIQTRREVLDTFSNEAYLRGVITKLREVTVRCLCVALPLDAFSHHAQLSRNKLTCVCKCCANRECMEPRTW
jgi:hypothetical protein